MAKKYRAITLKRLKQRFFIWLSNTLPLRGNQRWKFVRMGGVNIKGPCFIYDNVYFDSVAPHLITIGNKVTLTQGVTILTHFLDVGQKGREYRMEKVIIEDNAFIGCNTIICNSVTIGEGAVVGAGSIVTKDIPPYEVWAGNPARKIRDRAH